MTHQTLSPEKYWKLFPASLNPVYVNNVQRKLVTICKSIQQKKRPLLFYDIQHCISMT